MKRLLFLMLCALLFTACKKISSDSAVGNYDKTTSTTAAPNEEGCSTANCPAGTYAPLGCTTEGIPCVLQPNPPIGAAYSGLDLPVNIAEIVVRTQRPPKGVGDDILALALANTRFNNFGNRNSNNEITSIRYVIFDSKDPKVVLFEKTLARINTNSYFKAGDPKLSVTEQALATYKKYPTTANRRIVLQQTFDQFNTTTTILK
jgi:hypothetical protein